MTKRMRFLDFARNDMWVVSLGMACLFKEIIILVFSLGRSIGITAVTANLMKVITYLDQPRRKTRRVRARG